MTNRIILAAAAVLTSLLTALPASAGTDPYLGEIGTFAFDFCPVHWAPLDGKVMSIAAYPALFSLLGIRYGGDGKTTFALPRVKPIFTISPGAPQLIECISLEGAFPPRN